ncbi:hypothetical protein [Aeromonas bestiarum]|uniref:Uncharacterized protein n=1 Tax=Aeromonas bestiarum TaxID=105751 RepID=A0ABT7PZI3_9GAMM|nr:hypothetical protein [Aeromonas bestiarum]MDM5072487.1 hypothetical protein [Aeromonas bestiarum]
MNMRFYWFLIGVAGGQPRAGKHYENPLEHCFLTEVSLIGDDIKFDLNQ